jgi:hypothetical protein
MKSSYEQYPRFLPAMRKLTTELGFLYYFFNASENKQFYFLFYFLYNVMNIKSAMFRLSCKVFIYAVPSLDCTYNYNTVKHTYTNGPPSLMSGKKHDLLHKFSGIQI